MSYVTLSKFTRLLVFFAAAALSQADHVCKTPDAPAEMDSDHGAASDCVILVHGLARRKSSMAKIETALRARGYNVVNWDYLSTRQSIEESAKALHECYSLNATHNERVHFVTHSLGGILVRCMVKNHEVTKLGRIVMIAPPNQGSAVARMLLGTPLKWFGGPAGQDLKSRARLDEVCAVPKTPVLIISGTKAADWKNPTSWITRYTLEKPNDGTVTVAETKLPGIDNHIEVKESHTLLPCNPDVVKAVGKFLAEGGDAANTNGVFERGLRALSKDPARLMEILAKLPGMPNVPTKTMGGKVWWADLAVVDGWRVQEHVLMGNCRLLDPKNVRRAWGKKVDMIKAFETLASARCDRQ